MPTSPSSDDPAAFDRDDRFAAALSVGGRRDHGDASNTGGTPAHSGAACPALPSLGNQVGLALMAACIIVNDASFRVADPNEVSLDWQTALRLAICGLCGGYAVLNLPRALASLGRFPMVWLLLFAGWAVVTLPFAVEPLYASTACAAMVSMALFAAAIVARIPGEAIVKTIVGSVVLLSIGCWIAQFTRPELGQPDYLTPGHEPPGWRLGGLMHPNGLGAHCALALGMLLVGRMTWKWRWPSVFALGALFGVTLLCTVSRTSCLMVAALGASLAVRKAPGPLALAFAGLAGLVLAGEAAGTDWARLMTGLTRESALDEIYTLTGRTDLWETAIEYIRQSPIWGHGYGCSRYLFLEAADFPATHPHNQFLDTAVETGLVGAIIEAAMFFALARRLIWRPCSFPDTVLVLIAVMGIAECPVFNPLPEAMTLSWMLALGWRREESSSADDGTLAEPLLEGVGSPEGHRRLS
ncbi:MAG TPA: O-antigen ligase [Pirellulales bacterium]|nr:O-antigen ligase [Pirellulales bacterium]